MPRNMSFALTTAQVLDRTKTVTRRRGWTFLVPGERVWAVEKCMGLAAGERVRRLALLRVVSVRRERLCDITDADVAAEGFPGWSRRQFIEHFCHAVGGTRRQRVTRIELAYEDDCPLFGAGRFAKTGTTPGPYFDST